MSLLDRLKGAFGVGGKSAAAKMPEIAPPKVKGGAQAMPSHVRRSATQRGDQKLQQTDRRVATTDLLSLRYGTTRETIRTLTATSPDLSASINAYVRAVVTRNFSAIARNQDGTANPEATASVQQLLTRLNYLGNYTEGFSTISTLHAVAESLTMELRRYGSCSMELVLDKARLPARLQPISTTQIEFVDGGASKGVYPVQRAQGGGDDINLDTPAFFYETLDQDLLEAYSDSPMEAAVQATLQDTEFTNDVRRVIKRALHPRLRAKIDLDQFKKNLPMDILGDAKRLREYQDAYIAAIEGQVNGLQPEDALVYFDLLDFDYLSRGNESLEREYATLQGITNAKMASGAKVPGAVLGHGAGSQNIASTESLLFLRYAEGTQLKVNSIISRALTLGARLLGHDVYVEFAFDRIDLRPESELEAFRQMRQERVLTQLSIGLITDEEASILLTGKLPPAGAPKLSGTFFKQGATNPAGNPYSGTSQSTFGKATQPETPQQGKGPTQKQGQEQEDA